MTMKITAFWNLTPCCLLKVCQLYRGSFCFHHTLWRWRQLVPRKRNGKHLPDYTTSRSRICCSLRKYVSVERNTNDFMNKVVRIGCQILHYKNIFFLMKELKVLCSKDRCCAVVSYFTLRMLIWLQWTQTFKFICILYHQVGAVIYSYVRKLCSRLIEIVWSSEWEWTII